MKIDREIKNQKSNSSIDEKRTILNLPIPFPTYFFSAEQTNMVAQSVNFTKIS